MEKRTGSCHCGAVAFEAELDLAQTAIECNCSHCQKKGLLLQFIAVEAFALTAGEGSLTEYRFNTKKIAHLFCATCGVEPFARGQKQDGTPVIALNLRAIDGIDLAALERKAVNGKDF